MPGQAVCPICKQGDQVAKVSTIYIRGIESRKGQRQNVGPAQVSQATEQAAFLDGLAPADLEALSKKLTPPASRTEAFSRPLHPDQVVLVFSLAAPIFLYGVWTSQPASLPLALAALAGFYGFYFWRRKSILGRFQQRQQARAGNDARVRRAVERWMRLYYCERDECVFDPQTGDSTPVDQMPGLVFQA